MKWLIICAVTVLFGAEYVEAGTWTTLDYPGETETVAYGIDGSNIVGIYTFGSAYNVFLYDGKNWTTLVVPGGRLPYARGISGGTIAGYYDASDDRMHGFLYNNETGWNLPVNYANFGFPWQTNIYAIDGSRFAGVCYEGGLAHGFVYGGSWEIVDKPGASWTEIFGIQGSNLVGRYDDASNNHHGFLYDGQNWITLDAPGASRTDIFGIDGSNLVGAYWDSLGSHGFLYDGSNWTTLDYPGKADTVAYGISGNNIVGSYNDASGQHGFIYTIPEPASLLLLALGGVLAIRKR